jgi:tetratricopeptide (TPR) repeat protein
MSVRLLPFIARRIRDLPVLLIATAREESLADASGLSTAFDEIAREPHATVFALAPLSKDDTYSLISAAGRRTPRARGAADHIWAVSEGNPFVALEMVRAVEEGAAAAPQDRTPLPQRIRQVIRGRLDRLEPRARQLADAAAVIGRDFDCTLLREAVGLDERDAAAGLEELVRRRVVRPSGHEFAFAHDRIRHVVYDELLPPRRAALHHGVAGAIERLYSDRLDEVYDRLGYHYARTDQDERAVTYLACFAEQAGRRYALAEAVEALAQARARVERLPAPARERRLLELLVTEASYLVFLGRFGTLVDLLMRHRALVHHIDDPALEGPFYFWLALTLSMVGQHAEATADAERALAAARRGHDRVTQGRACAVLALVAFWSGVPLNGAEHARQAVDHLSATTDQEWLFYAHFYLAANCIQLGEFETAVEATRAALTIATAVDSARLETFVCWGSGWLETVRGNPAAGVEQCRRAARVAPDPLGLANALGFLGHAHLEHGEPRSAISPLEEAIARSAAFGFRPQQGLFSAWLAEAQLDAGNAQRARELAAAALQLTREVSFPYGIGMALRAAGRVALVAGDPVAGHAALNDALETFAAIPARDEVRRTEYLLAGT